jgi:hypothetical protein
MVRTERLEQALPRASGAEEEEGRGERLDG